MTTQLLPEPIRQPCNECAYRRDAEPGFFGTQLPEEFAAPIYSGDPVACHRTVSIEDGDWSQPGLRQCAGAARFRANTDHPPNRPDVAFGPADPERVFTRPGDFLDHHAPRSGSDEGIRLLGQVLVDQLLAKPGDSAAVDAELARWTDDLGSDRMACVSVAALSVMFGERMQPAPRP